MIQGLCIDLFHTLVDVGRVPDHVGRYTADILGIDRAVWNAACFSAAHPITAPTDHYQTLVALAHSIDPNLPHDLIAAAVDERQRRFDHALTVVDPQTLETLQRLRRGGLRLALVSNASSAEVAAWPRSPLAPHFDTAVFSCEVGSRKPEPSIYHHALERLGLAAGQCLFVGDGGSDEHLGAREVGLQPVLFTHFIEDTEKLEQQRQRVDWEVTSLGDLVPLVERLNRRPI